MAGRRPLDLREVHEFWRLQLLEDLRAKLRTIEYEPELDRTGRRRVAIQELIRRFEAIEAAELHGRR